MSSKPLPESVNLRNIEAAIADDGTATLTVNGAQITGVIGIQLSLDWKQGGAWEPKLEFVRKLETV